MHRRLTQSLLNLGFVCVRVCDIAENMVGQNLDINYVHTRQNSKSELNTKRRKIPFATHEPKQHHDTPKHPYWPHKRRHMN